MKIAAGFAILIGSIIAGYYVSVYLALWAVALLAAHVNPAMATLAIFIRLLSWIAIVALGFWLAVRLNRP